MVLYKCQEGTAQRLSEVVGVVTAYQAMLSGLYNPMPKEVRVEGVI